MEIFDAIKLLSEKNINIQNKTKHSNGFFFKAVFPVKVGPNEYIPENYFSKQFYFYDLIFNNIHKNYKFSADDFIKNEGHDDWEEFTLGFLPAVKFLKMGHEIFRKKWLEKNISRKICHVDSNGKFKDSDKKEYIITAEDLNSNDWMINLKIEKII